MDRCRKARRALACGIGVVLACPGLASAWTVALPPKVSLVALPAGTETRPVVFSKMKISVPQGQPYLQISVGAFCIPQPKQKWRGAEVNSRPTTALSNVFKKELVAAGFKSGAGDSSNMFDDSSTSLGEYEVGANITDFDEEFCEQVGFLNGHVGARGAMRMSIEWQVYSRLQGKLVATIQTTGGAQQNTNSDSATIDVLNDAFDQNVLALLASKAFIAAVSAPPATADNVAPSNSALQPIAISSAAPITVADGTGSVVAVFAGGGFGSGWVVADGYILTDRHVVGDASSVRIKWADQIEGQGTVVRTDARRDVALIKADTRGRPALPVRFDPLKPGETVFAIGTPLDPKLQNSVTRGVVSALRTIDGFAYVQSDVTVNHGDSGGPLLDERGRVVGLTESGLQPGGVAAGVNLFIPVRDSFDFLQLKLETGAAKP